MKKRLIATGILLITSGLFVTASLGKEHSLLDKVLDSQTDDIKARYKYRHPKETLSFFGIKPGMTVVELLPGGGWYSKILISYLGPEGHLIGVDYPMNIWPFFDWSTEEFIEKRKTWTEDWRAEVKGWNIEAGSEVSAYTLNTLPRELTETADTVLMIRALHNLSRYENRRGFLSIALNEAMRILKPGGVLGVVQHSTTDKNADGSTGYLERGALIKRITSHGFKFIEESDINANPKDNPEEGDIVWRLPPSLVTSKDNEEQQKQYIAIGESNRMTLRFVKPGEK